MALGYEVNKGTLDAKCAEAVISVRAALVKVETVAAWLANHPVVESVDPLTAEPFNYSTDEAYAMRLYFESVDSIRSTNTNLTDIGRKMTGLQ